MSKALWITLWLALLTIPRQLWATEDCFQCVLGIWDDPALSSNVGEIVAGQPKDIYVGVKFAEGFNGTFGISFSIAGLSSVLVIGVESIVPTTVIICDYIGAPADTSMTSTGTGGCTWSWPSCLVGNQALLRVTLLASSNVTNGVLQVKRQYPTPYPDVRTALFIQCNAPLYTPTRVKGGYYILNWDGDPSVLVDAATWSKVKQLYK